MMKNGDAGIFPVYYSLNDLLSLQQYMFNDCSIAGTVTDLFYIVYYYYLLNYMLYGHTNSMSMVQPGKIRCYAQTQTPAELPRCNIAAGLCVEHF